MPGSLDPQDGPLSPPRAASQHDAERAPGQVEAPQDWKYDVGEVIVWALADKWVPMVSMTPPSIALEAQLAKRWAAGSHYAKLGS